MKLFQSSAFVFSHFDGLALHPSARDDSKFSHLGDFAAEEALRSGLCSVNYNLIISNLPACAKRHQFPFSVSVGQTHAYELFKVYSFRLKTMANFMFCEGLLRRHKQKALIEYL